MRRTWDLDLLACPGCGERMALIATIVDERTARAIVEHLGLPATAPPRGRPWRPGQPSLAVDDPVGLFDRVDSLATD